MIVALYEPEIPPNTGNIARLCAAFDIELHLVGKLGFSLEDRYLKRAGLDYWPHVRMRIWPDWESFHEAAGEKRIVMATTRGTCLLPDFSFLPSDILLFGPETKGLPQAILNLGPWRVRLPARRMENGGVRSLNLSTAAGIFLYAALVDTGLINSFS